MGANPLRRCPLKICNIFSFKFGAAYCQIERTDYLGLASLVMAFKIGRIAKPKMEGIQNEITR